MGFTWSESSFFLRNNNEVFLKLSDYGITSQEVFKYEQLIKHRREETKGRHNINEHRSYFLGNGSLTTCLIFFFIVGHFNNFMRDTG